MKKMLRLFFCVLVFALVVGGGTWYASYRYFRYSQVQNSSVSKKSPSDLSNEYLDTLVVDIQSNLKSIEVGMGNLEKSVKMMATTVSVLSVIVLLNLILVVLLCLVILQLRAKIKMMNSSSSD